MQRVVLKGAATAGGYTCSLHGALHPLSKLQAERSYTHIHHSSFRINNHHKRAMGEMHGRVHVTVLCDHQKTGWGLRAAHAVEQPLGNHHWQHATVEAYREVCHL